MSQPADDQPVAATIPTPAVACPRCRRTDRQIKAGINGRNQRYRCQHCCRRYTPHKVPRGYPDGVRATALQLREQGHPLRAIGEQLGITTRTIFNWIHDDPPSEQSASPTLTGDSPGAPRPPEIRRQRPTIADVAQAAAVSESTVSNYLTGRGRMSEPTRARVAQAVADLHFSPNSLTRAIRERRTNIIGVLTFGISGLEGDVAGAITPALLQGISDSAVRNRQELLVYAGWPFMAEQYSSATFLSGNVDGLVWLAPRLNEPILDEVAAAGLPVMAVMTRRVPDGVGYVCCENVGGARSLTEHLLSLGHRRIAFVGAGVLSDYMDRRDGYRAALAEAGLDLDTSLEAVFAWDWPRYVAAIEQWLTLPDRPTAIVAADDGYARNIIEICRTRGLRVPHDMAVTGFNGVPWFDGAFTNYTTARQPLRVMAARAVSLLIDMIQGAEAVNCREVFPPEILVGGTTVVRLKAAKRR